MQILSSSVTNERIQNQSQFGHTNISADDVDDDDDDNDDDDDADNWPPWLHLGLIESSARFILPKTTLNERDTWLGDHLRAMSVEGMGSNLRGLSDTAANV